MKKTSLTFVSVLIFMLVVCGVGYAESDSTNLEPLSSATATSFLQDEAGITAYTKVSSVDLFKAQEAFKNVEKKTEEYIVGSFSLSDYGESDDVHIYADVSGWIAAYYLSGAASELPSKILDWKDYGGSITSTKLEDALVSFTSHLNKGMPYTEYYDFRYPEAEKIMIITDGEGGSNNTEYFKILIPESYTIYSRTWSFYFHVMGSAIGDYVNEGNLKVDDTKIIGVGQDWDGIWEGKLTPTQLSPDQYHTISIYNFDDNYGNSTSYAAIVLIYKE